MPCGAGPGVVAASKFRAGKISGGVEIIAFACRVGRDRVSAYTGNADDALGAVELHAVQFLPILQIADITGAYGVSFLMMLVNGAMALVVDTSGQNGKRPLSVGVQHDSVHGMPVRVGAADAA